MSGSKNLGRAVSAAVGVAALVSASGALAQAGGGTPVPSLLSAQYVAQSSASVPDYEFGRHDQYFDSFSNDHGGALGGTVTANGSATVSLNATTSQTLSVSANVQGDTVVRPQGSPVSAGWSAGGTTTLQYSLAVYGPTKEVVPLKLVGYAQLAQTSGFESSGAALVQYGLTDFSNRNLWSVAAGSVNTFRADCESTKIVDLSGCGTTTFESDFDVRSWAGDFVGDEVNVHLYASAGASIFTPGDGSKSAPAGAIAIIDPMVIIDPVWAAAHPGFSVAFSDNVGQGAGVPPSPGGGTGGVPEPATWALMIAGFGLAGAGLRRRRAALV